MFQIKFTDLDEFFILHYVTSLRDLIKFNMSFI